MGQEDTSPSAVLPQEGSITISPPASTSIAGATERIKQLMGEGESLPPHSIEDEGADEAPKGQAEEAPVSDAPKTEEAPEPAKDNPVTPQAIALKIGDKEYTIPADQIPEELRDVVKDGILMRADYTRKTQEVAEERKAIEAAKAQTAQAFQMTQVLGDQIAAVKMVDAQIAQYQNVDWAKYQADDPIAAIQARQSYQELLNHRQGLANNIQQAYQSFQQYGVQQIQEAVAKSLPELKKAIPDFNESKAQELREYGKTLGFNEHELLGITDHRAVIALHKAYLYDKLMSEKTETVKKVQALPPKTVKSGVGQTPGSGPTINQSAYARLQRSGKTDDAAAVIKSLLG
jgi:hypothetical protein